MLLRPVVDNGVVTNVSNDFVDAVDTAQDRSSTNCITPMVTRLDSKSLEFVCKEQESGQISIAMQLDIDMHKSMQSTTVDSGRNSPFSAETLSLRFHISHSTMNATTQKYDVKENCTTSKLQLL